MISFLLDVLRPFRFWIFSQLIAGVVWAIDLGLRPYILKTIIDKIPYLKREEAVAQLIGAVTLYLSLSLMIVLIWRIFDFSWLKLNPPLKRHIADQLMNRMMRHSMSLFQNHFAGDLASKIKDVMSGVPDLLKILIYKFFSNSLAVLSAIVAVSTIHYKFSLLLLTWLSLFVLGSAFLSKRAQRLCVQSAEARSRVMGHIVDSLSNVLSVHLFSALSSEAKSFRKHLDQYVTADQKRDWWFLWVFAFQGFSFFIYQVLGFIFLIQDFKTGSVTGGDFALLIGINLALINSLWSLSEDILKCAEVMGNISQGLQIVLAPFEIQDKPGAPTLCVKEGALQFDTVKFHYKGTQPLFQNLSVTIPAGQKVGLVGYSGSGKSTFVNLILRLYEVTEGCILIDGQDIREVTQDSLHRHIAMIPQDPSLFHRSLLENIRYGRREASDEEVIAAAKKAHAHEFISKLPQGYESLVGERGVKLSGGQRQRIAIARAILKNAPILILDEATSQLDSVTELLIQESLWNLMQGKTTLVIAHRLSTLSHMDKIFVFDEGEIVQQGSESELLKKDGLYKTLRLARVGGFLPDQRREQEV